MIRARFKADENDPRPINWPLPHPYWITGYGDGYSIVVAYADDEEYILKNWPEARDIESTQETEYSFSDRFSKPDWFKESSPVVKEKNLEKEKIKGEDDIVQRKYHHIHELPLFSSKGDKGGER